MQPSELEKSIIEINWFVNCGQEAMPEIDLEIRRAKSWNEAVKSCNSLKWENTTLEARNCLSRFVGENYPKEFRYWNDIARKGNQFVIEVVRPKLYLFAEEQALDKEFLSSVEWDILSVISENAYRHLNPPITFFSQLLVLYKAGHLPCGWSNGEFPNGALKVY